MPWLPLAPVAHCLCAGRRAEAEQHKTIKRSPLQIVVAQPQTWLQLPDPSAAKARMR
ncbi:hypothetical protein J2X67_002438 [Variovorax sp. 3319]|nr:hypothetical protein [Variovorax sp. 3319]